MASGFEPNAHSFQILVFFCGGEEGKRSLASCLGNKRFCMEMWVPNESIIVDFYCEKSMIT